MCLHFVQLELLSFQNFNKIFHNNPMKSLNYARLEVLHRMCAVNVKFLDKEKLVRKKHYSSIINTLWFRLKISKI